MAKTLLNGVNDVLKRLGYIKGNSGELASLTDSQRQVIIDLVIQSWNELLIDVYDSAEIAFPNEVATSNITLATSDRDYVLPSDLVYIRWPLINQTYGYEIFEYPGGWDQLRRDQTIPANYTGRPQYAAVRPTDGYLYLERIPTSAENGLVYVLTYDKSLLMDSAADTFPFIDDVYQMLIPCVTELVKRDQEKAFDEAIYRRRLGQAASLLTRKQQRQSWTPQRLGAHVTNSDPLES